MVRLGRRSAELAFFSSLGLPGATRGLCGATLARLMAFDGWTGASAGGLACSTAFDVSVYLLVRQNAGLVLPLERPLVAVQELRALSSP